MNLLPIAIPAAPGNVIGAENPGTAGSGDFAALVAMLVATASTTLPVDLPMGDFSRSGDVPEELPTFLPANPAVATPVPELPAQPEAEPAPLLPDEILPVQPVTEKDTVPAGQVPVHDQRRPMAQASVEEAPARVVALDDTLRPVKRANEPRRDEPPVERPTSTPPERELPVAAAPREKPDHVVSAAPVSPVAVDAPEKPRPDTPAPEKAEGLPASKIAVVPSASHGSAPQHPVVPLVAAVRSEALVPVETPPPAPVVPASVPEQIVSAVVPLHGRGDGRHEVTLELRPDNLGTIRVEVSVEHQTVHLTLHAAEPATSRLLAAALPDLRSALIEAGLTTGQLGVGPDGGGGAGQRRRAESGEGDGRRAGPARDRSPAAAAAEPVRTIRPAAAGRLDLFL
jgi:flagellar hook-length control protein FliK